MREVKSLVIKVKFKKVNLLSRAEMRKVMGGNPPEGGEEASCYCPGFNTSPCPSGTKSCSAKTKKDAQNNTVNYIECDGVDKGC